MFLEFTCLAANGNLAMAAQTTIESSGQGFYYFCKSYNIFPTLTQESACRRVAQHVRYNFLNCCCGVVFTINRSVDSEKYVMTPQPVSLLA